VKPIHRAPIESLSRLPLIVSAQVKQRQNGVVDTILVSRDR
jgi:hypothetical protein